jgi:hypothetical protein
MITTAVDSLSIALMSQQRPTGFIPIVMFYIKECILTVLYVPLIFLECLYCCWRLATNRNDTLWLSDDDDD